MNDAKSKVRNGRSARTVFSNWFGKRILLLVILSVSLIPGFSQQPAAKLADQNTVNPVDLINIVRELLNKNDPPRTDSLIIGVRNTSLLPIIGYGPANGFVIGAAVGVTKLFGNRENTQLSAALLSLSVTTEEQILLCMRSNIYLPGNKWYFAGDARLLFFSQPTYGLGIYDLNSPADFNIGGIDVSKSRIAEPMRYNYIRFYETAQKQFRRNWYAGVGISIDYHYQIDDENLKLDTPNPVLTYNYLYSKKYGFDPTHYSTNGLHFVITHDTRDNPINAYKGSYASVSFRVNEKIFGGSQNSTMLYADLRKYFPLKKSKPGLVLAFWSWGTFVTSGNVPYLALPAIGWDTYGRSGRGYVQGRFRGVNMVYGETEFRMPISRNGLFGAVAFINGTTASNPTTGQGLFNTIAPAYGVGLRIKMNMKDRTNICIDYGRGRNSSGLYFNIQETF